MSLSLAYVARETLFLRRMRVFLWPRPGSDPLPPVSNADLIGERLGFTRGVFTRLGDTEACPWACPSRALALALLWVIIGWGGSWEMTGLLYSTQSGTCDPAGVRPTPEDRI